MDDILREVPAERLADPLRRSKGPAEGLDAALVTEADEFTLMGGGSHDRLRDGEPFEAVEPPEASEPPEAAEASEAVESVEASSAGDAFEAVEPPEAVEPAESAESVAAPGIEPAQQPQLSDDDEEAEALALTDPVELSRVLLAVLLSSREPLSILRLAQACNASQEGVTAGLDQLQLDLRSTGFPLEVSRSGESVRLLTLPEVFPYLRRLRGVKKVERLSPAALETLAVIAYRQPVMRVEVEAIRGVKAGPMLRTLLEHKLVDVVGRADVPGRPLQYGTTQAFLDRFGMASLKDLPSIREFKSLG